jgi:hypothetical protein
MRFLNEKNLKGRTYRLAILLGNLSIGSSLIICAYLGTFSRLLADDYCHNNFILYSNNLIQATITSYNTWSDRYSNLLLIQFIEWGGNVGQQLMSAVAILLWLGGLTWLVSEIGKSIHLQWRSLINSWIAGLVIFLSFIEAPNLYQVLYWRSGFVTYLAPLVFFVYVTAFFLWQYRTAFQRFRLLGTGLVCVVLIFIAGGSSETTGALQISILLSCFLIVFLQKRLNQRKEVLWLLGASLASAIFSMVTMALAPGNSVRLRTPTSDLIVLIRQTIIYTAQFIWLTLRTLPLPSAIALLVPFFVVYLHNSQGYETQPQIPNSSLWKTSAMIPVILFIAVAFSFAPSAFAESYPVDRARFPAVFLMTLSLAAEGGVLAILASRFRLPFKSAFIYPAAALGLCLLAIYPIHAVYNLYIVAEPEYRSWAVAWDARQEKMLTDKTGGIQVQVVPRLPGIGYIKELDSSPDYWVNRCAEKFYGIQSIKAIRFDP